MSMWLVIAYAVVGPLAWVGMWAGLLLARSRMKRLETDPTPPLPDPPPTVTVIVPAKDEAADIADCINRIRQLDYPDLQILAVNDRSTDDTGAILDKLAHDEPRLRVIHIAELPDGWLGKCHALHVAQQQTTSEWILFVDSDVVVQPNALTAVLALATTRKFDAVSILTRLRADTAWEKIILPPAALSWGVMFGISLTNDDGQTRRAAANGQFLLVRASAYRAAGGHQAVRQCIVEDVELMRALKHAGSRVRLYTGFHLARTRMQTNLHQIFHGWARIYSGTARRRPWPMVGGIVFVLLAVLSAIPMLILSIALGDEWGIAVAGAHLLIMHLYMLYTYRRAGVGMGWSFLLPIAGVMLIGMMGFAIRRCFGGTLVWRGTTVTDHSREGFLPPGV
jgi:chlorobactene glucosyltransferase